VCWLQAKGKIMEKKIAQVHSFEEAVGHLVGILIEKGDEYFNSLHFEETAQGGRLVDDNGEEVLILIK
jgi:hypothetical protein